MDILGNLAIFREICITSLKYGQLTTRALYYIIVVVLAVVS